MKGAEWWLFRVVCPFPVPGLLANERGEAWCRYVARALMTTPDADAHTKTMIVWKDELLEAIDAFDSEAKALAVGSRHTERTKERCVILMTIFRIAPCRGATALESCHTRKAAEGFGQLVPGAFETCPVCGHLRARRELANPNAPGFRSGS